MKKEIKEKRENWEKEFEEFLLNEFDSFNKRKTETHRWLFCWTGEQDNGIPFDCACCLDGIDHSKDKEMPCGCICHKRIEQLKSFIRQLLTEEKLKEKLKELEIVKLKFAPGVYPHQLRVDHGDVSLTKQLKELINAIRPIKDEKTKDSRLIQGIIEIIKENRYKDEDKCHQKDWERELFDLCFELRDRTFGSHYRVLSKFIHQLLITQNTGKGEKQKS